MATLVFGWALVGLESDTDLAAFIRPGARVLSDVIEEDFEEGGQLTLIFESRSDRSLLDPKLLHVQLRIMNEIHERFDVTTFSLVEGIDEGLRRIKRKSLLNFDQRWNR